MEEKEEVKEVKEETPVTTEKEPVVPSSLKEVRTIIQTEPPKVEEKKTPPKRKQAKKKEETSEPAVISQPQQHSINLSTALVYSWERERKERAKNEKWTNILDQRLKSFEDSIKGLLDKGPKAEQNYHEQVEKAEEAIIKDVIKEKEEEEKEEKKEKQVENVATKKKTFAGESVFGRKRYAPYQAKKYF